jgi:hypothetical protein
MGDFMKTQIIFLGFLFALSTLFIGCPLLSGEDPVTPPASVADETCTVSGTITGGETGLFIIQAFDNEDFDGEAIADDGSEDGVYGLEVECDSEIFIKAFRDINENEELDDDEPYYNAEEALIVDQDIDAHDIELIEPEKENEAAAAPATASSSPTTTATTITTTTTTTPSCNPNCTISGTITGGPTNVVVQLMTNANPPQWVANATITGSSYSISNVADGTYLVVIINDANNDDMLNQGEATAVQDTVTVSGANATKNFTIYTVSGTITGGPSNVIVQMGTAGNPPVAITNRNSDGSYTLYVATSGTYNIQLMLDSNTNGAVDQGESVITSANNINVSGNVTQNFTLYTVSGTVTGRTSGQTYNTSIMLYTGSGESQIEIAYKYDTSASFTLYVQPPGVSTYNIKGFEDANANSTRDNGEKKFGFGSTPLSLTFDSNGNMTQVSTGGCTLSNGSLTCALQ